MEELRHADASLLSFCELDAVGHYRWQPYSMLSIS